LLNQMFFKVEKKSLVIQVSFLYSLGIYDHLLSDI
jgi:hypothetical protein